MTALLSCIFQLAAVVVTVDGSVPPQPVAPTFQGVFIEDVSRTAEILMTEDGFRAEAVEAISALKPGFIRFPGGCAAQGRTFEEQFDWKRTICPPEARPCVSNLWGYTTNFRLGFYEYFLLCEKVGATPVPVVAAGMTCHHFSRPHRRRRLGAEMDAVARDACDLVEFANGSTSTFWGAKRAAMGHPEPFGMKYLSIGNEDIGTNYFVRYRIIAEAVRRRHPGIRLIASAHRAMERDSGYPLALRTLTPEIADILDEHFYFSRTWLAENAARFDGYPRTQSLAVTEYAHKQGGTENTPASALLDMAFLLHLLRNADLVEMTSYAPLLAWKGRANWSPNLLWFDGEKIIRTPNYELQRRFAENRPEEVLKASIRGAGDVVCVVGRRKGKTHLHCVNPGAARKVELRIGDRSFRFGIPAETYEIFEVKEACR